MTEFPWMLLKLLSVQEPEHTDRTVCHVKRPLERVLQARTEAPAGVDAVRPVARTGDRLN